MRTCLPSLAWLSVFASVGLAASALAADTSPVPNLLIPAVQPTPAATPKVPLVASDKLITFLPPTPTGWVADAPQGSTTDSAELRLSTAQRSYNKGDDENALTASVTIIDFAGSQSYFEATTAGWELTSQTPEGYDKAVEIDGMRGFEHYTKADKASSLALVVSKRYFIEIELTNQDPKELREWLKRIDAKKLSEAK